MRTYRMDKLGSLDGLVAHEEPTPTPGPGEVLLRVKATALNVRDTLTLMGKSPFPVKTGVIPMSDAAGEVAAVGSGVTRFQVGDRVVNAFFRNWYGGPRAIKLMVLASAFALATTGREAAAKEKQMTLTAASEVTFENLMPDQEGGAKVATAATVSGDRKKGPHLTLIKLPAGTVGPLHTHSSEVDAVVISGVVSHWHEGETQASAKPLPAGSYFKQPAKIKHYSACAAGADCLMAVFQKGKFDANRIDAPKAAKAAKRI